MLSGPALPCMAAAQATTFGFTRAEQSYAVPAGVSNVSITAIGGTGGTPPPGGGVPGGRGAVVTGIVAVTGGPGPLCPRRRDRWTPGRRLQRRWQRRDGPDLGGGGATDVRTIPESAGAGSLDSRVAVAAGGGGSARIAAGGGDAGSHGGCCAAGGGPSEAKPGTGTAGGAGGCGTSMQGCGAAGTIGRGGDGGSSGGPAGGFGGGGGGGLFGGGGGAGSTTDVGGGRGRLVAGAARRDRRPDHGGGAGRHRPVHAAARADAGAELRDPAPAVLKSMATKLVYTAARKRGSTRFTGVRLRNVPAGSTVVARCLTCKGRRGSRSPRSRPARTWR